MNREESQMGRAQQTVHPSCEPCAEEPCRPRAKPRVLIVYETMGMGHRRMADIFATVIEDAFDVEIVSLPGSEILGSTAVSAIVDLWNYLLRKAHFRAADLLINSLGRLFALPIGDAFDVTRFLAALDDIHPDLIVSAADVYSKALGTYCRENHIPLYLAIADISVYHDVVNPVATHLCYFHETADAVQSFDLSRAYFRDPLGRSTPLLAKLRYLLRYWNDHILHARSRPMAHGVEEGVPLSPNGVRCIAVGPLAKAACFRVHNREQIAERLGLRAGRRNILIASGSIGGRLLDDVVTCLCAGWRDPANLLVMCGNDDALYAKIQAFGTRNPHLDIHAFHWVDNFDDFLAIADCVIGRHSASVFVDSLVMRIPCIAYGYVLANDCGTAALIQKHHLGEMAPTKGDLVPALRSVLENRAQYVDNIDRFLAEYAATYDGISEGIVQDLRAALDGSSVNGVTAAASMDSP
ncbi:MAG: hypothetical protein JXR94_22600 [Candidatus Hydrogenedentes bacterium]|nr:hypothetical protein [Candidatus Hydrogenedentota bacterium]